MCPGESGACVLVCPEWRPGVTNPLHTPFASHSCLPCLACLPACALLKSTRRAQKWVRASRWLPCRAPLLGPRVSAARRSGSREVFVDPVLFARVSSRSSTTKLVCPLSAPLSGIVFIVNDGLVCWLDGAFFCVAKFDRKDGHSSLARAAQLTPPRVPSVGTELCYLTRTYPIYERAPTSLVVSSCR